MKTRFDLWQVGKINGKKLLGCKKGTLLLENCTMVDDVITLRFKEKIEGHNYIYRKETGKYDKPIETKGKRKGLPLYDYFQ